MNVEHINMFIQGSQSVITTVCAESTSIGKTFVKGAPYKCETASFSVNISGDVSGYVIYTMAAETACGIASKMMGGMPVAALDDMSASALSELTNMISGNAATLFSGKGLKLSLSAPVFKANAASGDFVFIKPESKVICVPLAFSNGGVFEIDILFT